MDLSTFTTIHTAISIIAIIAGIPVIYGLFGATVNSFWTTLFLVTAVLTSATGFGFPFNGVLPSHVVGAIALVILALVIVARYVFHGAGPWRWIYAAGMVFSLYFLVFVAIAQAFMKVPALRALAPTQSELPFALSQGLTLVIFVALSIAASKTFRPSSADAM
ncbi:hypothetical protein [Phreatobacter stygius]|uniref:DUF2231 domain-containing protein n=1 Tax=Phreatobacter stygius TaxID=1940610 RepID=A0A4D7B9C4_9HYPH|nr:hypothetical protein [Phreatobacter stygius]QCI67495.1 hypothetical protein E8M01_26685 [Phreatobacter stygius]